MEATGDMLENKPILKSDENDVGERSCDLINGLTSKYCSLIVRDFESEAKPSCNF